MQREGIALAEMVVDAVLLGETLGVCVSVAPAEMVVDGLEAERFMSRQKKGGRPRRQCNVGGIRAEGEQARRLQPSAKMDVINPSQ